MSVIFFDTETTSLLAVDAAALENQAQIVEVYCIKTNYRLDTIAEFHAYCKPTIPIAPDATKVHGITDDMVKDYKPFALHYTRLAHFFAGTTHLVGHNLMFDKSMLLYELRRFNKEYNFPWPIFDVCTVEECVKLKGHRMSLGDLHFDLFGEMFAEAHSAKADTLALRRIYLRMLDKEMVRPPERKFVT